MATQTLTLIGSKEVRACRNPPGLFQKVPGKGTDTATGTGRTEQQESEVVVLRQTA